MVPPKMRITPEKTAESASDRSLSPLTQLFQQLHSEEVERTLEEGLQLLHSEEVERTLEKIENNPAAAPAEKEKAAFLRKFKDFADFMRIAWSGATLTEGDLSKYREQIPAFQEMVLALFPKAMSGSSPELRSEVAQKVRSASQGNHSDVFEEVLQVLNLVDSEKQLESDKEKA